MEFGVGIRRWLGQLQIKMEFGVVSEDGLDSYMLQIKLVHNWPLITSL